MSMSPALFHTNTRVPVARNSEKISYSFSRAYDATLVSLGLLDPLLALDEVRAAKSRFSGVLMLQMIIFILVSFLRLQMPLQIII